jgi:hypothetical protein
MLTDLHRKILEVVRSHPDKMIDGEIKIAGYDQYAVLEAADWLVRRGYLEGAFPLNANWPDGYEWGWVNVPGAQ